MPKLYILGLANNGLQHIFDGPCSNSITRQEGFPEMSNSRLWMLNLKNNNLTKFPNLAGHTRISFLRLSYNQLTYISSHHLVMLNNLEELTLAGNLMISLAIDQPVLPRLTILDLSHTMVTSLPDITEFYFISHPRVILTESELTKCDSDVCWMKQKPYDEVRIILQFSFSLMCIMHPMLSDPVVCLLWPQLS